VYNDAQLVYRSDSNQTLLATKDIDFFLQIIKRTFIFLEVKIVLEWK